MSVPENDAILESICDELEVMSVNDFSNLVEEHGLGSHTLDNIFYQLAQSLLEERST
jgi:hypothetical protein|tara:strand:- start:75 stop:245 length:171 start_codon:yes stop_codon:yes gene_type:complete